MYGTYEKCLPFASSCPPWVVAPGHACAVGAQVAKTAAEEQNAPEDAQDIEDGEAIRCRGGLLLDCGFKLCFVLLANRFRIAGSCGRCWLPIPSGG